MLGWFVGQVMKATGGKANPQAVNDAAQEQARHWIERDPEYRERIIAREDTPLRGHDPAIREPACGRDQGQQDKVLRVAASASANRLPLRQKSFGVCGSAYRNW